MKDPYLHIPSCMMCRVDQSHGRLDNPQNPLLQSEGQEHRLHHSILLESHLVPKLPRYPERAVVQGLLNLFHKPMQPYPIQMQANRHPVQEEHSSLHLTCCLPSIRRPEPLLPQWSMRKLLPVHR